MLWTDLPLHPDLVGFVQTEFGFDTPTEVQHKTIPQFLAHKDVVVEAVTGSGKTLAYLLPLLHMLFYSREPSIGVKGIVVAPTRELAVQIHTCLCRFKPRIAALTCRVLIGGTDIQADIAAVHKDLPTILIATPGRLDDLLSSTQCAKPFSTLKQTLSVLVLDEADRLLDLGFSTALQKILGNLPKQRRTGLFSATMNDALDDLVRTGLRNPCRLSMCADVRTPVSLQMSYVCAKQDQRLALLLSVLDANRGAKTIVYFATCACVDYFHKAIGRLLVGAKGDRDSLLALHGKMVPKKRNAVTAAFMGCPGGTLLCTDLTARGLDFPHVELVVHMDAPQDPKNFAHRCGRAGRAGLSGRAILFISPGEETYIELLRRRGVPISDDPAVVVAVAGYADCNSRLVALNKSDRDFYDKSIIAFVSYIRFFTEHYCKYIFVFKQLDMVGLAQSFGLLHLPRVPELKQFDVSGFVADSVTPSLIPYADAVREEQRQKRLAKLSADKQHDGTVRTERKTSVPWSKSKDKKDTKKKKKRVDKRVKLDADLLERLKKREDEDELHNDWREYKQDKKKGNGRC